MFQRIKNTCSGLELTTFAAMDVMILLSMMFALRFAFAITILNYLLSKVALEALVLMLDFFTRAILQIRQELLILKQIGMFHRSESMTEGLSVCPNKLKV